MGSLSDYIENKLLDHALGTASYTQETNLYVGLSTADPLDDASGIAEPSGNNYARVNVNNWDAAASRLTSNTSTVTFNQASGSWGTITHWFVCNHATNTTWGTDVELIAHGSLATSKSVVNGNTPSFAAGELDISFNANGISDYLANALLDHVFKNTSYTQPTIYVALTTANINDSDTGSSITEPSGNNYARKAHASWDAASGGASENTGAITFNTPSGSWGTVLDSCLVDASSAGNMLFWCDLDQSQTPDNGDTVQFADGAFDITMS